MGARTVLSGTFLANGNSDWADLTELNRSEPADDGYTLAVNGAFGGGTLEIQVAVTDDKTTPTLIAGVSLTAAGSAYFNTRAKYIRIRLSGATGPAMNYALFH